MPARVSTGDRDAVRRQIRWCAAVQTLVCSSCAKTGEPTEMPFAVSTRVGPRNHILGVARVRKESHFWEVIFGRARRYRPPASLDYCARSIFSTLFAREQRRCDLWLPVICSSASESAVRLTVSALQMISLYCIVYIC